MGVQDYDQISKLVDGGNNTYFVRISWKSDNLEDLNTNYDVNWYWMSPVMDEVGPWEEILFYYTPYLHYANLTQLNTLPPIFSSSSSSSSLLSVSVIPIDTTELGINSFRDAGARYYFEKGIYDLNGQGQGVILRFDLNYSQEATAIAF